MLFKFLVIAHCFLIALLYFFQKAIVNVSDPSVEFIHLAGLEFVLDMRAIVLAQMTKAVESFL